jgi:hypothetical protein
MAGKNGKGQQWSTNQTYIAQAVSSYMEPLGITDRKQLEEITNIAIQRLEGILPGMESLIVPGVKQELNDEQIKSVINQILEERQKKMMVTKTRTATKIEKEATLELQKMPG